MTPYRGCHPSEINKSDDSDERKRKKRSSVFSGKNRGDTVELTDGDDVMSEKGCQFFRKK